MVALGATYPTTGTIFNDQFGANSWDDYISALEALTPTLSAIGSTDYYGVSTCELVRAEKKSGRLGGYQLIFPNIKCPSPLARRGATFVNMHLLVDPADDDHVEQVNNILSRLTFRVDEQDYGCTTAQLTRLGRHPGQTLTDDRAALAYGSQQYKVSLDDFRKALDNAWATDNVLVAVAAGADGTSAVKDGADVTLRRGIERFADIIFSGSPGDRDFGLA